MGRFKGLVLLFLSALLAAGAGGVAYALYMSKAKAEIEIPPETIETESVVVAAQDMPFGTEIQLDHVELIELPKNAIPVGAYARVDSLLGQTTKISLVEGELILASKLSLSGGGLSIRIPESMRASSIRVNKVSGVSGFILPGERVDVIVTIDNLRGSRSSIAKTILQNVSVVAAGVKTEIKNDKPVQVQSVTLLVDPQGAEDLALAMHRGVIHLVLRNPVDHEIVPVQPRSIEEVMRRTNTGTTRRRAPAPKPKTVTVPEPETTYTTYTIIRGGKIEKQQSPTEKSEPVKR